MVAAHEIIVGGANVYHAPVGSEFPEVYEDVEAPWSLIGTLGDENYGEAGVLLRFPRTFNSIRALGTTMPRKTVISETGFQVEFDVMDLSLENLAVGYGVDPGEVVENGLDKSFSLPDSPVPYNQAILVRLDQSPYIEDGKMQFEIFSADQVGTGEGTFSKTGAFQIRHIWSALKTASGVVIVRAQSEASSS